MRIVISLLSVLLSCGSFAQQSFSLEEALAYAEEYGFQNRMADLDVQKAKHKVRETIAIGLPQIQASGNYQHFIEQPVQVVPAEFFGGEKGEFAEVVFGTKQNASGQISASQLIFDGSYLVGLQATRAFLQMSKRQSEKSQLETKVDVANAYCLALAAQENLRILKESLVSAEKLYQETLALQKSGFASEQDVDQIEINFSRLKASIKQAENQIQIAFSVLKFQMGMAIDVDIVLSDPIESLIAPIEALDQNNAMDINNNIDFKLAQTNKELQQLNFRNAKAKYLPRLGAFANYQQNSFANDFNFLEPDAKWFPTALVGINLEISLFTSGLKHQQVKQAQIELKKASVQEIMAREGARLELETTSAAYKNAQEVFALETRNLKLSEKIKSQTSIKFKEGMSSTFELAQAQNQLAQTQGTYIRALVEVLQSKIKLEKALNRL